MSTLISLHDFLMAARNSIIKSTQQIADFNNELLNYYFDPETGEPITISFKTPGLQSARSTIVSVDAPLLAISPLSMLGLSLVSIALEAWVLKVDGVIFVTIPSEIDQNPYPSSTKVNFSFVVNPSQAADEFDKELESVEARLGNQMLA